MLTEWNPETSWNGNPRIPNKNPDHTRMKHKIPLKKRHGDMFCSKHGSLFLALRKWWMYWNKKNWCFLLEMLYLGYLNLNHINNSSREIWQKEQQGLRILYNYMVFDDTWLITYNWVIPQDAIVPHWFQLSSMPKWWAVWWQVGWNEQLPAVFYS